jgi:hypothetical protein
MGIFKRKQSTEENTEGLTPEFLELERKKRYGYLNRVEETGDTYRVTMFFPTIVPPSEIGEKLGLPSEMPDYVYDASLDGNSLIVKARLTDEKVLRITGLVNSFPDRFLKEFAFDKPVSHFETAYENKVLNIVVYKAKEEEEKT